MMQEERLYFTLQSLEGSWDPLAMFQRFSSSWTLLRCMSTCMSPRKNPSLNFSPVRTDMSPPCLLVKIPPLEIPNRVCRVPHDYDTQLSRCAGASNTFGCLRMSFKTSSEASDTKTCLKNMTRKSLMMTLTTTCV